MRTAEHNDVRAGVKKRPETLLHRIFNLRTVQSAGLNELDKTSAHMLNHSHIILDIPLGCQILGAFQRACCGKHSYYSALLQAPFR